MPGVSSPGARGGSHRPHSQPHLDPVHPICHPNPHNISNPVPTPTLGQEVERTPRSRTHTHLQFLSGPVSSIFPGLWPRQICRLHLSGLLYTQPGPSLTTCCLHPYQAILLTASCLHPCPSPLHSLWQTLVAAHCSGSLAPHPLLPSFSLSLSLSFLCLPPSIGASNHRYP